MKCKLNTVDAVHYIFLFLVVYLSGSVISSINSSSVLYNIILYCTLFLGFIISIKSISKSVFLKFSKVLFVAALYVILEWILSPSTINLFITRIIWLLLLGIIAGNVDKRKRNTLEYIYYIVIFIAVISLIFYVFIHVFRISLPYSVFYRDQTVSWSLKYNNYAFIYFENPRAVISLKGVHIQRLSSFFWEPGAYQIFLNFAVYWYLFHKQNNRYIFTILSISVLLTISTTGLGLFVLIFIFYKIRFGNLTKKGKRLLFIPAIILIIGIFLGFVVFKIDTGGTSYLSYLDRTSDIKIGLQVFKKHILVGTGFDNTTEFFTLQGSSRGNTNGIITLIFTMGILGLVVFITPFISNTKRIRDYNTKLERIVYILWFIISNASEPILVTPFFWLIYALEIYQLNVFPKKVKGRYETSTSNHA